MYLHSLSISVIVFAVLATVWLVYYTRVILPREFEEKCRQSMSAFSTAIEKRAPMHKGLALRVSRISRAVGRRRGLPNSSLIELELAAHLRGIGLCGLPFHMLQKDAPSQWTVSQKNAYDQHVQLSAGMVEIIPALRHLGPIIYSKTREGALVTQESRDILELTSNYIWTERWEGPSRAVSQLEASLSELQDPQIGRELLYALQNLGRDGARG